MLCYNLRFHQQIDSVLKSKQQLGAVLHNSPVLHSERKTIRFPNCYLDSLSASKLQGAFDKTLCGVALSKFVPYGVCVCVCVCVCVRARACVCVSVSIAGSSWTVPCCSRLSTHRRLMALSPPDCPFLDPWCGTEGTHGQPCTLSS